MRTRARQNPSAAADVRPTALARRRSPFLSHFVQLARISVELKAALRDPCVPWHILLYIGPLGSKGELLEVVVVGLVGPGYDEAMRRAVHIGLRSTPGGTLCVYLCVYLCVACCCWWRNPLGGVGTDLLWLFLVGLSVWGLLLTVWDPVASGCLSRPHHS